MEGRDRGVMLLGIVYLFVAALLLAGCTTVAQSSAPPAAEKPCTVCRFVDSAGLIYFERCDVPRTAELPGWEPYGGRCSFRFRALGSL
jgi:hypothetical protein